MIGNNGDIPEILRTISSLKDYFQRNGMKMGRILLLLLSLMIIFIINNPDFDCSRMGQAAIISRLVWFFVGRERQVEYKGRGTQEVEIIIVSFQNIHRLETLFS